MCWFDLLNVSLHTSHEPCLHLLAQEFLVPRTWPTTGTPSIFVWWVNDETSGHRAGLLLYNISVAVQIEQHKGHNSVLFPFFCLYYEFYFLSPLDRKPLKGRGYLSHLSYLLSPIYTWALTQSWHQQVSNKVSAEMQVGWVTWHLFCLYNYEGPVSDP